MKKVTLLYILILSFFCIQLNAKDYTVNPHKEGKVIFIKPQKIKGLQGTSKKLLFDISYLTSRDYVTFTATYKANFLLIADSISIKLSDNEEMNFPLELLYVNRAKEGVVTHRITFDVPIEVFKRMYEGKSPYKITLANDKHTLFYEYPIASWGMKKQDMNRMIRFMDLY